MKTIEEYKEAKSIYDECVIGGLLIPEKLKRGYRLVTGITEEQKPLVSIRECKQQIFSFFQFRAEEFLKQFEDVLNLDEQDDDPKEDTTELIIMTGTTITTKEDNSTEVTTEVNDEEYTKELLLLFDELNTLEDNEENKRKRSTVIYK